MQKVVGIGNYEISNNKDDTLKTLSLGSCIGITLYSAFHKVAAMLHIALPNKEFFLEDNNIWRYANTAIPSILDLLKENYDCNLRELKINICGGSQTFNNNFHIGYKNILEVVEILSSYGITCDYSNIGGNFSRDMEIDVETGKVIVVSKKI